MEEKANNLTRDRLVTRLLRHVLIWLVRGYQAVLSPMLAGRCRFHPTCSEYAIESLRLHAPHRALWLTTRRLLRCQPFCRGGYDPVPVPRGRAQAESASHEETG